MIDSRAIISEDAQIGKNVSIGANAIIENSVIIGNNTQIMANAVIAEGSIIGTDCRIFYSAMIGTEPQDLKYRGEKTETIIGDRTVVREFATINRGTLASGKTVVGSDCLIMTYCHVAHDSIIGNHVILSNVAQLAGHTIIEDWVILGGVAKITQFCRIGKHAMIGASTKITQDVLPYALVGRENATIEGINKIGLERRGFSKDTIKVIRGFFKQFLASDMNTSDALDYFSKQDNCEEIQYCLDFIKNSERGILKRNALR